MLFGTGTRRFNVLETTLSKWDKISTAGDVYGWLRGIRYKINAQALFREYKNLRWRWQIKQKMRKVHDKTIGAFKLKMIRLDDKEIPKPLA
jgi:hypothetical protein